MHWLATRGDESRVGLSLAAGSGFPKTDSADYVGSSPTSSTNMTLHQVAWDVAANHVILGSIPSGVF
jgi:hypothetical protein